MSLRSLDDLAADAEESVVLDETSSIAFEEARDVERRPATSPFGAVEYIDRTDGADGEDIAAGTEAKYSAPELGATGTFMPPNALLLLARSSLEDLSLRSSSSVLVRGRGEL